MLGVRHVELWTNIRERASFAAVEATHVLGVEPLLHDLSDGICCDAFLYGNACSLDPNLTSPKMMAGRNLSASQRHWYGVPRAIMSSSPDPSFTGFRSMHAAHCFVTMLHYHRIYLMWDSTLFDVCTRQSHDNL